MESGKGKNERVWKSRNEKERKESEAHSSKERVSNVII